MDTIHFKAVYGDIEREVTVSYDRYGTGSYQVTIDGFYNGNVFFKDGYWQAHLNSKSELTTADIQAIGERLEELK